MAQDYCGATEQEQGPPQQQQTPQDWQRTRHDAGGTVCRGRAGAPDRGARRADGHSSGEGADPARWAQGGWCKTKQARHSTDGRHCGQQQTTARGGQGALPCPPTAVPHVPQSNGICHWTCARADEPVPVEGSAVTEPVPKPQTAAKPRRPQQTTARRGTGGKTCRSPDPQRHSPHATRHYGETWCQHRPPQGLGRDSWQAGLCENTPTAPACATEQGPPVPGT